MRGHRKAMPALAGMAGFDSPVPEGSGRRRVPYGVGVTRNVSIRPVPLAPFVPSTTTV